MSLKQPLLLLLLLLAATADCRKPHIIDFRSPNLYPHSFTWDPKSDHFIVAGGSHLISVSDAGVVSTILTQNTSSSSLSFLSISLDPRHHRRRLLAVIHHQSSSPALAAYHLPSLNLISLTSLPNSTFPSHVASDYSGNAYVTDASSDTIYKVTEQGHTTILSRSQAFQSRGLSGVVYNPKGYLLVAQSSTGKLFKVDVDDGTARRVLLNRDLIGAERVSLRGDGVVLVVSASKVYFLKSDDSWSEGVVFDETALDGERQGTAVAVGAENRVYVLYGHVNEARMGSVEREREREREREVFSIVEVESRKESKEENVMIFVLIGLGLAYVLFWRFQMRQLAQNMNKKTS